MPTVPLTVAEVSVTLVTAPVVTLGAALVVLNVLSAPSVLPAAFVATSR